MVWGSNMSDFSSIFQPITIKRTTIKNRIVMPPIGTNFATLSGEFVDDHIQYYEQRAKGGTGLIILENVCIDYPYGTNGTTQLRIDNDQYIPGLFRFTERMHKHGALSLYKLIMQVPLPILDDWMAYSLFLHQIFHQKRVAMLQDLCQLMKYIMLWNNMD